MSVWSRKRLLAPVLGVSVACVAFALIPATTVSANTHSDLHGAKNAAVRLAGIKYGHTIGGPARVSPTAKAGAKGGFNIDGQNWSGAAIQGNGFSTVNSSWTEPSVSCNSSNDLMAPWVGIDGYGSSSVEQTGVATDCSTGSAEYAAWYEVYPAAPVYYDNPVAAGDSISASVSRSGTSYTLVLTDNTQGWSKSTTQSYNGANSSAEVIIESPTGAYPSFGSVNFSGSTVDGTALGSYSPDLLDASNSSGFEDHTSAVSGGNFSISYEQE
jgi:hypothetical protein